MVKQYASFGLEKLATCFWKRSREKTVAREAVLSVFLERVT